jgi:hypothetical protein
VKTLNERLLGVKKFEKHTIFQHVNLHRTRLEYESHIEIFVGADRHGFDVSVPDHGFKIRITCPREVPDEVEAAPWDDLLQNLCKIDRAIIKSKQSKAQPLSYVSKRGLHPMLRVEVLSRAGPQEESRQLPGA